MGHAYNPRKELVNIFEAKTEKDKGATTNQLEEWAAFLKRYDGLGGKWKSTMRPMDPEEDYISAEKQFQNQKQYENQTRQEVAKTLLESRLEAEAKSLNSGHVQPIRVRGR